MVGCLGAAWVAVWGPVWGTLWRTNAHAHTHTRTHRHTQTHARTNAHTHTHTHTRTHTTPPFLSSPPIKTIPPTHTPRRRSPVHKAEPMDTCPQQRRQIPRDIPSPLPFSDFHTKVCRPLSLPFPSSLPSCTPPSPHSRPSLDTVHLRWRHVFLQADY